MFSFASAFSGIEYSFKRVLSFFVKLFTTLHVQKLLTNITSQSIGDRCTMVSRWLLREYRKSRSVSKIVSWHKLPVRCKTFQHLYQVCKRTKEPVTACLPKFASERFFLCCGLGLRYALYWGMGKDARLYEILIL